MSPHHPRAARVSVAAVLLALLVLALTKPDRQAFLQYMKAKAYRDFPTMQGTERADAVGLAMIDSMVTEKDLGVVRTFEIGDERYLGALGGIWRVR